MIISLFDLYKIGIGPSSSHTVGPMWAANRFLHALQAAGKLNDTARVGVCLYGSLALTGHGHATDTAILLGLAGEVPDEVDPDRIGDIVTDIRTRQRLKLFGKHEIRFIESRDLLFLTDERLPGHANGMRFTAWDAGNETLLSEVYYSTGGGFVAREDELEGERIGRDSNVNPPFPFSSARQLLDICRITGMRIADVVLENEKAFTEEEKIRPGLFRIWGAMQGSIRRGCSTDGVLPGGLNVTRRAHKLYNEMIHRPEAALKDPLSVLDWVNIYALAVNEENAAGGRVVTAPTNGAAGVIPAVLAYYDRFCPGADEEGIITFLATAGAIGMLIKHNASISAAEVGCQGEVGAACSMAAAGLVAAMGGSNEQAENAAEIGMEHNLGLTCDPVNGLVQVPCIERNTMGAMKAINAARLALKGDGTHMVSLDEVIETMRQTGLDMQEKYKETAEGGLAVNVVEC